VAVAAAVHDEVVAVILHPVIVDVLVVTHVPVAGQLTQTSVAVDVEHAPVVMTLVVESWTLQPAVGMTLLVDMTCEAVVTVPDTP
jgi:hypothetical protein